MMYKVYSRGVIIPPHELEAYNTFKAKEIVKEHYRKIQDREIGEDTSPYSFILIALNSDVKWEISVNPQYGDTTI